MKKPILYIPLKNYFINDVFEHINDIVNVRVFNFLGNYHRKSKQFTIQNEKKQYYIDEAEKLKKNIPLELFSNFIYNLSSDEHIIIIKESSLAEIIYKSPNIGTKQISIYDNELIEVIYVLDNFKHVFIDDYEDFISKFIEVKGDEYHGLIKNIIDFILMNVLIELANNIDKNKETKYLNSENNSFLSSENNELKWHGTQTEFIELVKALIENGNIRGTQKVIINKLTSVFNIEINNPNKLINDLKKRNNDSETLFLDKLKKSLFDYITLEKKK
jgi:hypothetical protein